MAHLVTYNAANGTVVESCICLGIKEWALQYSGREANLVCGGIVIGVHRLRSHLPLVAVNWLASLVGYFFL